MRKIPRICLNCGSEFEGRANRVYCSTSCKNAEKNRRRRGRSLEASLAHARRTKELAEVSGHVYVARMQDWRMRMIETELECIKKGV